MRTKESRPSLAGLLSCAFAVALAGCGDSGSGPAAPGPGCAPPSAETPAAVVLAYGDAWGESDPGARSCLLETSFAPGGIYTDPTAEVLGREALVEHIGTFRGAGTGGGIETSGVAEYREGEGRFGWLLVNAEGIPVLPGEDWVEFAPDGRLSAVHGFFGAGTGAPMPPELRAWQEAWNATDEVSRRSALERATTDDVRFTDALTDVSGRDALAEEMARQQELFGGYEVVLADQANRYETPSGAIYLRHTLELVFTSGSRSTFTNYVRIRDGRIERLAGFPGRPLAETN